MGLAADFRFMRSLAASSIPCAAARSTRSTSSHPQHLVCKSAASVVVAKRSPFLLQCVRPLAVLGRLFFSVPAFPWVRFVSLLSLLAVHSCGWACPRLCRVLGSLGLLAADILHWLLTAPPDAWFGQCAALVGAWLEAWRTPPGCGSACAFDFVASLVSAIFSPRSVVRLCRTARWMPRSKWGPCFAHFAQLPRYNAAACGF